jgi:hypothetical protein
MTVYQFVIKYKYVKFGATLWSLVIMHVAGKVDCTQLTARLCPPNSIKNHFEAKNCMSQMKLMNMGAHCCTEMGHI